MVNTYKFDLVALGLLKDLVDGNAVKQKSSNLPIALYAYYKTGGKVVSSTG